MIFYIIIIFWGFINISWLLSIFLSSKKNLTNKKGDFTIYKKISFSLRFFAISQVIYIWSNIGFALSANRIYLDHFLFLFIIFFTILYLIANFIIIQNLLKLKYNTKQK